MKEKNREPNLIVYTRQNYTALEKDVVSVVVNNLDTGFNVQPDLFKNKTITVSAKMLDLSTDNYHRLKKVSKSLTDKKIEIVDDENEEFDFIVPFPRVKYKKGTLELTMFADVVPHFLELKNGYTEYYLKESLSLKGVKTKRLYELLSSRKKLNYSDWKVYDDVLKNYLDIDQKTYKGQPSLFWERIILKSVEEINEKTSLIVEQERDKDEDGWFTVLKIKEKIKETQGEKGPVKELDEKSLRLVKKLNELGIKRKDLIDEIVDEYQVDCWKWFFDNTDNLKNKKFRSPAGVLLVHLGLVEAKI